MDFHSINRIAFTNVHGQLCTIGPDGSNLRVLTGEGQFCQFPAWSPDSRYIAAINSDRRSAGVVVTEDAEDTARSLYNGEDGPPIYLYWAPGGKELSFIAAEGHQFGLHFADLTGSRRVRAHGQPFFWRFLPEGGAFLAHTNGFGQRGELRLLNTHGEESGHVLSVSGYFQAPDVAPRGDFLAYTTNDPQHGARIMVARMDGDIVRQLAHQGVVALGWSPRENELAFIHPTEQADNWYGPLQLLDVATGEVRLLVEDEVLAFFWSPDGSAIAYLTLAPPPRLHQRDIGAYSSFSNGQRYVLPRPQPEITLSVAVVNVSNGATKRLARFEPQALFINQFLPFFDQYSHSHRLWSPDSRALVLPVLARSATAQIAVVPRDGSRAQIIGDGTMAFWSTV